MRRFILPIILILWAIPSFAQWSAGNATTGHSTDGTPATAVTTAMNTTGAKQLIAVVTYDSSCTSTGIVDSKSNSWTPLVSINTGGVITTMFRTYNAVIVGTGHTFTPTASGSTGNCGSGNSFSGIAVLALNNAGTGAGARFDQLNSGSSGTSPVQGGSVSPTAANEVVISGAGMGIGSGVWTGVDSGFTIAASVNQTATSYGVALAYLVETTATSVNPSWTWTGSPGGISMVVNGTFFNNYPQCTGSSPTWTAGSFNDIQACHLLASNGDTVNVNAGTFLMNENIDVTKSLSMIGAGAGSSIVQDAITNGGNMFQINLVASKVTRLSGFTFEDGGRPSQNFNGIIQIFGLNTDGSQLRIDHNTFDHMNGVDINPDTVIGVIDHNTFLMTPTKIPIYVYDKEWDGGTNGDNSWVDADGFGSSQFLFIETNTFTDTSGSGSPYYCIDALGGARFVVRYNSFNFCGVSAHGTESAQRARGTRAIEIYQNTFVGPLPSDRVADIRSGIAYIHDNRMSGFTTPSFNLETDRMFFPFTPWGEADGTNVWDVNLGGGPFFSGTATSGGTQTVTVSGATWTTNQWAAYSIVKTSSCSTQQCSSYIESNTATTITFHDAGGFGTNLAFTGGDTFSIYKVTQALDQPGREGGSLVTGSPTPTPPAGWNNQTTDPDYEWNNPETDQGNAEVNLFGITPNIVLNTHYINATPAPGYTPYVYPYPLAAPPGSIFSYSRPINFTSSATQIPASQSNFPYVVHNVTLNASHVLNSNGYDIRPYADSTCSTTPLPYQLISYNNSTGALVMWISGTISAGGQEWFCYGASSLTTDGSNITTTGTFPGYSVRIHGSDGSTVSLTDVSGNSLNGTNGTFPDQMNAAAGEIVGSFGNNGGGGNTEYAFIPSTSSIVTGSTLSMGTWLKGTTAIPPNQLGGVWEKSNGSTYDYMLYWNGNTGGLYFFVVNNSATAVNVNSAVNYLDGNWHKVKGTWDGTNMRLYIDGVLAAGPTSQTGTLQNSSGSRMGWVNDYLQTLAVSTDAAFEESLVRPTADSANWEASEYYNEKTSSTFLSLGSEVPLSSTGTGSRGRMRQP